MEKKDTRTKAERENDAKVAAIESGRRRFRATAGTGVNPTRKG
jgi:hypothetical protein